VPPPEVVGVWESLMLLVNNHILKMTAMLKPSAEYNRTAAIIEGFHAERSATEIIRFFGYPRSTVYDVVAKYTALEQSKIPMCQRGRITWKNAPRGLPQSLKGLKRWFWMTRAIVVKISIDCWCKRANNASNYRGGPSIQIIYIKNTTDVLWGCQDKPSCSPRLPFWPFNSSDLNPLNYYVCSVFERVTNKPRHPNVTSLKIVIEAAFVGMDSATLQRAKRFRSRIETIIQANGKYIE